ncbi:hypothetical protein HYS10_00610 [Candidatus Collierbacteria bacterium]|nr:hypothetical protein [Candidatus Collierbacteria bacterium]
MEIGEAPKPVEVLHIGDYDVVLNNTAVDQDSVRRLVQEIRSNLGSGKKPLDGWIQNEKRDRLKIDKQDKPRYFAKEKWSDTETLKRFIDFSHGIRDDAWRAELKQEFYKFNSLLREVSLSPKVRALMESEDAQEIARKYGYSSIRFLEPLIGFIDKKSGKKTVIYYYVDGESFRPQDDLIEGLATIFRNNGIEPYDRNLEHGFRQRIF